MEQKTIAAISTPSGVGGLGVIRISGKDAVKIADTVFKSVSGKKISGLKGYTALFGKIEFGGEAIDECVALYFKGPKSYTGEDVVELSLHGGTYVLKEALRAVYGAGAVPAKNGEFTKRAYLNGKLNLLEAEAVMGIISADGKKAQRAALSLLTGAASPKITEIKNNLLTAAAGLTVFSDYPDDELPEFSPETLNNALTTAINGLEELIKNYDKGKVLREGVNTVIAGRPNVGKSTLMNLISQSKRSIVTSTAGTTRDVVENTVNLGDIILNLSDTAGLRETEDEIEKIGVDLSREKIKSAGLLIAVFDKSEQENQEDLNLIEICKTMPSLAVLNKSDLQSKFNKSLLDGIDCIEISAQDPDYLKAVTQKIEEICGVNSLDGSEILLCSERQRNCLTNALKFTKEAKSIMDSGVTLDAVGVCLDDALAQLLSLTGERVTNAVIDEVFNKFCVGK